MSNRQSLIRSRQKYPRRGLVTSQSVSKFFVLCPTKQMLIQGTRRCLHCLLHGLIYRHWSHTSRRLLPISFLPFAPRWGLVTMQDALRNCLSSTGHAGRGKDKDSVLPRSYWQEWWNWESTKEEFQNMATKAGVMWFVDENVAFFFWTMLRSSLQQWQSWSCAKVVIVRQLNQNDWPVTSNKDKPQRQQTKTTPNNHTGTKRNHMFLTNQWKGETGETGSRSHYLVAENLYTNPGSHNLFSIL